MIAKFPFAISVVVPMFNEAENAVPLVQEIVAALNTLQSDNKVKEFEIIIIDDGSTDQTYQNLIELKQQLPPLRVVQHPKNFGQSAGVVTGVRVAKNPWIVTLDGDGQNDPADIGKLLETLSTNPSASHLALLIGNRKQRNDNWIRKCSSAIANSIRSSLLKDSCPDSGCGLKLFSRETFLQLPHFKHMHRFLPALFIRAQGSVINVAVNHRPRIRGTSKYGVMNRLWVGIVDLFGVAWLLRRPSYYFNCDDSSDL